MEPTRLAESERSKPISYDPATGRFVYLADVLAGATTSPRDLTPEQQTRLVLRRYRAEPELEIESLTRLDLRQQIEHIRGGTETGTRLVEQEITFLDELISKIRDGTVV